MKNVLLTLKKPSDFFIKSFEGLGNPPYAILLIESRMIESYTIEPIEKDIKRKEADKTISPYDRTAHTHYSYETSCIVYNTKDDLTNKCGTYLEFIPDELTDELYEYSAEII